VLKVDVYVFKQADRLHRCVCAWGVGGGDLKGGAGGGGGG
jgi:hypothetical protein